MLCLPSILDVQAIFVPFRFFYDENYGQVGDYFVTSHIITINDQEKNLQC